MEIESNKTEYSNVQVFSTLLVTFARQSKISPGLLIVSTGRPTKIFNLCINNEPKHYQPRLSTHCSSTDAQSLPSKIIRCTLTVKY